MPRVSSRIVIICLLPLQAGLLAYPGWTKSLNQTEAGHLGAGVYLWNTLRFDVFHANPPLTRMVSGLPCVVGDAAYDGASYSSDPLDRCEWPIGRDYLAANRPEQTRWRVAAARWCLIPFLLIGGYCGYRLCSDLYGSSSGLLFLVLWCFSPFVLSWGATICPDAVAAALGIPAVLALRRFLCDPGWSQTSVAGVSLGLLPLTKLTWTVAYGLWPLIWLLWMLPGCWKKDDDRVPLLLSLRQLAFLLLIGLWTLNTGYFFEGTFRPLGEFRFHSELLAGCESVDDVPRDGANRFAGTLLGKLPVPLPAEFVQGMDTQRHDFNRGFASYLRGRWEDHGWWCYYLYALAVKMPLGTWSLVALAIAVSVFGRGYCASWRDEMLIVVPGLAILILVSSQTGFSVHSRYMLPALPLLFVWSSKVARVFEMPRLGPRRLAVSAMVLGSLVWSVASSLWGYPHSLSYFNELAGGPQRGAEHLLGSNLDWGQDLFYLKDWLDDHPEVTLDGLAIYGTHPVTLAGIPETSPPPPGPNVDDIGSSAGRRGPRAGWYALSANNLYVRSGRFRYFVDHFRPAAMAGYSIAIYRITPANANSVWCRSEEMPPRDDTTRGKGKPTNK